MIGVNSPFTVQLKRTYTFLLLVASAGPAAGAVGPQAATRAAPAPVPAKARPAPSRVRRLTAAGFAAESVCSLVIARFSSSLPPGLLPWPTSRSPLDHPHRVQLGPDFVDQPVEPRIGPARQR